MRYKKYSYIIVLILMLTIGINKIYADEVVDTFAGSIESKTCYYMSDDNNLKIKLDVAWTDAWNLAKVIELAAVRINKYGPNTYDNNKGFVSNWYPRLWSDGTITSNKSKGGAVNFDLYYQSKADASKGKNFKNCPTYLVFQECTWKYVWATESINDAMNAAKDAKENGCTGYYASHKRNGREITSDEYYREFVAEGMLDIDKVTGEVTCADYETIFGNKDNPESIRYMVDTALTYIRIIVPILIILLGTIDFAKAVLAGKEDNMKKAQKDFARRVAAGIIVFFVPTIVDIVMYLADIVWAGEYPKCVL